MQVDNLTDEREVKKIVNEAQTESAPNHNDGNNSAMIIENKQVDLQTIDNN